MDVFKGALNHHYLTSTWTLWLEWHKIKYKQQSRKPGFRIEYNIPNKVSLRELCQKTPAHGSDNITKLLYADGQVVIANLSDELQQILTIYDKTLKRFGLQMSYEKRETMVQESIVSLSKEKIKNVRKFKYLGYTITNSVN